MDNLNNKLSNEAQKQPSCLAAVSGWRMFEATLTLKDGTKRTYISSTLGGEEEAKKIAINNDWSSPAIDAVIAFR